MAAPAEAARPVAGRAPVAVRSPWTPAGAGGVAAPSAISAGVNCGAAAGPTAASSAFSTWVTGSPPGGAATATRRATAAATGISATVHRARRRALPSVRSELAPHRRADAPELVERLAALPAMGDVLGDAFDGLAVEVGAELQRRRVTPVDHRRSRLSLGPVAAWERWRATRLRAAWRRDMTVPMLTDCTSAISA